MSLTDSFGALAASIVAVIVMLVFAILSVFITVFVVDVAASLGNLEPSDDFVVLGATIIAGAAIVAGGSGLTFDEQ